MGRIKARYQTKHYNKFARGAEQWQTPTRGAGCFRVPRRGGGKYNFTHNLARFMKDFALLVFTIICIIVKIATTC